MLLPLLIVVGSFAGKWFCCVLYLQLICALEGD